MIIHGCNICTKIFKRRTNLEYHTQNNVCSGRILEINKDCKYNCKYCNKGFTTGTSMYRHMNRTCKVKKSVDEKKEEIYNKLIEIEKSNNDRMTLLEDKNKKLEEKQKIIENENKALKAIVKTLGKKSTKVIKNNHTYNINNGVIANINLIGYGHEDLSKIDKNEIINAIKHGFKSTIHLTESVHFNPKYPEYHNIYIANINNDYGMMYNGSDWTLIPKEKLIDMIYDDKKNYIEENLNDFVKSLEVSQQRSLNRWLETDDTNNHVTKIKKDIKVLLYNKRKLATKNISMIENNITMCKSTKGLKSI